MISFIAGLILAGFVAFGVTEFTDEPSPHVASFMEDVGLIGDYEPVLIEDSEIYSKLERDGVLVYVVPGTYKVPRMQTVWDSTYESYCSVDPRVSSMRPSGWDCQDYSNRGLEGMEGYAWGVAYSYGDRETGRVGHMVNVGLVETRSGAIKILFYEPNNCTITSPPEFLSVIVIGVQEIKVTEDGLFWEEVK
jgi:hypothetical protein